MKLKRFIILETIILIFFSLLIVVQPLTVHADQIDDSPGIFRQRSASVYIDSNDQSFKSATLEAMSKWEKAFNLYQTKDPKKADITVKAGHIKGDAIGITNSQSYLTSPYHAGQCHIIIDNKKLNDSKASRTDKVLCITHELGHAIGLGHDDHNEKDVMYPSEAIGGFNFTKQEVTQKDLNAIDKLYKHVKNPGKFDKHRGNNSDVKNSAVPTNQNKHTTKPKSKNTNDSAKLKALGMTLLKGLWNILVDLVKIIWILIKMLINWISHIITGWL